MVDVNALWERLGTLEGEEAQQVITRIFEVYEQDLARSQQPREALRFFQALENALDFCQRCNLNRR